MSGLKSLLHRRVCAILLVALSACLVSFEAHAASYCPVGTAYVGNDNSGAPICNPSTCPVGQMATITANGSVACAPVSLSSDTGEPPTVKAGGTCPVGNVVDMLPNNTWYWRYGCSSGPTCPTGWVVSGQLVGPACVQHCSASMPKDYQSVCGCAAGENLQLTYDAHGAIASQVCKSTCPDGTKWNSASGTCASICPQGSHFDSSTLMCAPDCPPGQSIGVSGVCSSVCTAPQVWSNTVDACVQPTTNYGCNPPAMMVKGVCLTCPVGQTYSSTLSHCTPTGNSTGNSDGDGYLPPTQTTLGGAQPCPPGRYWDGLHCMSKSPPPSSNVNEGSGNPMVNTPIGSSIHSCEPGMYWNGLRCMKSAQQPPQAASPCPTLSTWTGLVCVGPRGKEFCPQGMSLQGRQCVAAQTSICPPASTWTGGVCIGPRGKAFCPERMVMRGRVCVVDRLAVCPSESAWTGEFCVGPRGKAFCPTGMTMRNGVCMD